MSTCKIYSAFHHIICNVVPYSSYIVCRIIQNNSVCSVLYCVTVACPIYMWAGSNGESNLPEADSLGNGTVCGKGGPVNYECFGILTVLLLVFCAGFKCWRTSNYALVEVIGVHSKLWHVHLGENNYGQNTSIMYNLPVFAFELFAARSMNYLLRYSTLRN